MNQQQSTESIETLERALDCLATGVSQPLTGPATLNWSERCVEVPWAASLLTDAGRLLDVGWSMSPPEWLGVLLAARSRGVDLVGIDIINPDRVRNRYPANLVDQVFEVPVRVESVLEAQPDGELFDTITCISTLEHIGFDFASEPGVEDSAFARATTAESAVSDRDSATDGLFLDSAARFLRPGGSLLVSVPAGKGGPILHQDSLGFFTHQFEYDPTAWKKLISDQRFSVKSASYFRLDSQGGWEEVGSCEALADQTSALKPFATGCAMAQLVLK
jgi:SAM-dependent methyltransferase